MQTRRFLIFIAIVQTILWLGHAALYATAATFLPVDHTTAFWTLLGLSLTLITASLLAHRSNHPWVRLYYLIAVFWLGLGHFLLIASGMTWAAWAAIAVFDWNTEPYRLGGVMLMLAIIAAAFATANARTIRTTRYTVALPDLPDQWRGRTAVWISDSHLGHINGAPYARRLARRIRRLQPDIVFLGGDIFDGVPYDLDTLIAPLAEIAPPLGSFFITGNHEEFGDPERFLAPVRNSGITTLVNDSTDIDNLRIIGVEYGESAHPTRYDRLLARLTADTDHPTILLKHSPTGLSIAAKHGIDLQISGHTHRGQLFPFHWITRRVYGDFDYGLRIHGSLSVLASSGAGTWGPPMRLASPTEIVTISFS